MTARTRGRWIGLLAGTAALLAAQPAAADDPDPLNGDGTTLFLDPAVATALGDAGITLNAIDPAEAHGGGVTFPITGGKLDPAEATGRIKHSGGLRFKSGPDKVALKDFVIELADQATLTANAGKADLKVFNLDLSGASIERDGFNTEVSGVEAALTNKAAKALNTGLDTDVFAGGVVVGEASGVAVPESVALLPEGDTTLALDEGAADALESLGITPGVVAPATAGVDGLAFPITGGRVDTESLAGVIRHSGGISLTKDDTVVELKRFDINIDDKPDLTAKVGGDRVSILKLDLSGATIHVADRSVTVSGVEATLTKQAADALNAAFATDAFAQGLLIGTATVSAEAR